MRILNTIKFITGHPLNRTVKAAAVARFIRWQFGSRLVPGPVACPFVNGTRLLVKPGMTGATGNIYSGLHEFEDMAFLLHLLRPGDLFADIGANIGSYTILASGAVGAHSLCCEPIPTTFLHLLDNLNLNDLQGLVEACNCGIGEHEGTLSFTVGLDTVNHVATGTEESSGATVAVKVVPLDALISDRPPRLIKIDVEGFETKVIRGARQTLSASELDAVIMELNGSGARYGFDETAIHRQMLDFGFTTWTYAPFERRLHSLGDKNLQSGNTLYLRNLPRVESRLATAPQFEVLGRKI